MGHAKKNQDDENPVRAIRFSPHDWTDVETAAKLMTVAPSAFVRIMTVRAARAEIKKAGKKPATG